MNREELEVKIEDYLRKEVSCLHCGGEMCDCDGSHDKEKRSEMAKHLAGLLQE